MAFVLIGRIIAVDQQQTVASKNDASKTFQRRQVYLDCSRYDSITGEQLSENKPLLEFGGKGLDQLGIVAEAGIHAGATADIGIRQQQAVPVVCWMNGLIRFTRIHLVQTFLHIGSKDFVTAKHSLMNSRLPQNLSTQTLKKVQHLLKQSALIRQNSALKTVS